jgi:hypothetical protein
MTIFKTHFGVSYATSSNNRVFMSELSKGATGLLLVADTAYFVYLGMTVNSIIPKYVEFFVPVAGVGTQTAEVGFFSTPAAPNKANQSLTKLVSTGTVDALTGTGVMRNTVAFTAAVAPETYLWAGIRTAMGTTQPTIIGLSHDMAQGNILATGTAGALTAAGPWTGAVIAAAITEGCPDLRGVLD